MDEVILLRVRDVAVCLKAASRQQFVLSKIQLQKLIYLMDVLSVCLEIVSVERGHYTYYHGPYDKNIQNAADMLVFWGFSDVKNICTTDNGVMCEYYLTEMGIAWIGELLQYDGNTKKRFEVVNNLLNSLVSRNLMRDLVSLVYAEPLFVKNKCMGYGIDLNLNDLDQNDFYLFFLLLLDAYKIEYNEGLISFFCDFIVEYLCKRKEVLFTNEEEE